jgi:hypothetical protein
MEAAALEELHRTTPERRGGNSTAAFVPGLNWQRQVGPIVPNIADHFADRPDFQLGNILSAQFYAAALKANPDIPCEISSGEFGTLHTWLRDSVYQHGSKFAPNHLIERAAGAAMNMTPYFDYLREKYAALYRLQVSFGGDSGTLPSLL